MGLWLRWQGHRGWHVLYLLTLGPGTCTLVLLMGQSETESHLLTSGSGANKRLSTGAGGTRGDKGVA